jgi:phage portal protein BeeE
MKFESLKNMTAVDSQLIDQLKWSDEKICSTLHVPPYMVGVGAVPTYNNIEALNQQYYSQCLHVLIASMELCREEGIGVLEAGYEIDFNLDELIRMDSATKMKTVTDGVRGGIYTPNEGRKIFNRKPLKGGDTVYLQEQDHSLTWLSERDAQGPAPLPVPAAPALPEKPAPAMPVPAKDAAMLLKTIVAKKAREAGLRVA